jgi:hypothetical protein
MVVAKGGIEPPTRGFSILSNKHLHALITVDKIQQSRFESII